MSEAHIFTRVGSLGLNNNLVVGYALGAGNISEHFSFGLVEDGLGQLAAVAGEDEDWSQAVEVELCGVVSDADIEGAETKDGRGRAGEHGHVVVLVDEGCVGGYLVHGDDDDGDDDNDEGVGDEDKCGCEGAKEFSMAG